MDDATPWTTAVHDEDERFEGRLRAIEHSAESLILRARDRVRQAAGDDSTAFLSPTSSVPVKAAWVLALLAAGIVGYALGRSE